MAARIDDSADEGVAISWVETDRPVLVLPGASAADAQSMVAVLQASLEVRAPGREGGRVALSAGIAELTATADGPSLLRRAEAALDRARRAGAGAVVVSSGDDDGA